MSVYALRGAIIAAYHEDVREPFLNRRQLAGRKYYGSWNWIMIFVISGLVFLYLTWFVFIPYARKCHHWYTRRRVTAHLDGFDEADFEEAFNATRTHVNEETGEIVLADPEAIAKARTDKRDEIELMRDMLRKQKQKLLAKQYAEECKVEAAVLGPDGLPLLEDFDIDECGNKIPAKPKGSQNKAARAAFLAELAEHGLLDEDGNEIQTGDKLANAVNDDFLLSAGERAFAEAAEAAEDGAGADAPVTRKASSLSPSRDGGDTTEETAKRPSTAGPAGRKARRKAAPKKLTGKKLAAVEKLKQERKEFREAYKAAIHRPTTKEKVEERVQKFEEYMLHGKEPLGYSLELETTLRLQSDSDLTLVQLMRHSNYFHKIEAEEAREKEKKKYANVRIDFKPPKSAIPEFNSVVAQMYAPVAQASGDGNTRDSSGMGFIRKKPNPLRIDGKPLRSEGKKVEDGAARDPGIVNRGFGTLPTRTLAPVPHGVRAMKNGPPQSLYDAKQKMMKVAASQEPVKESFASDGSGLPASEAELIERGRKKEQRLALQYRSTASASPSPDRSRSPSPVATKRPQTAKQFRRSYY